MDHNDEHMDLDQHQHKFFDIGYFDRRKVDLNKPAMTVEEYLQQVIVDREQQPVIAVAPNYSEIMQKASTSTNSAQANVTTSGDSITKFATRFGPNKEWSIAKSNEFSLNRSLFEDKKAPRHLLKGISLPPITDSMAWCQICFERRLEELSVTTELEERFAHHQGTPPTLGLLKSLNDNQVNYLIEFQAEYIVKRGYTRARLEWMYALLLAVKKPLLHEVCASLREFCRKCREWRAEMDEDESGLIHELSWFIAIISIYFAQRDLADD